MLEKTKHTKCQYMTKYCNKSVLTNVIQSTTYLHAKAIFTYAHRLIYTYTPRQHSHALSQIHACAHINTQTSHGVIFCVLQKILKERKKGYF